MQPMNFKPTPPRQSCQLSCTLHETHAFLHNLTLTCIKLTSISRAKHLHAPLHRTEQGKPEKWSGVAIIGCIAARAKYGCHYILCMFLFVTVEEPQYFISICLTLGDLIFLVCLTRLHAMRLAALHPQGIMQMMCDLMSFQQEVGMLRNKLTLLKCAVFNPPELSSNK